MLETLVHLIKVFVLFDSGSSDDPSTATNFYGFGLNSQTLRYQTAVATHAHKFLLW